MAVKLFAARNFIIGANVQVYRHSTDFIQINAPDVIDVIADGLHYFIDLFLRTANRESAVNKAFLSSWDFSFESCITAHSRRRRMSPRAIPVSRESCVMLTPSCVTRRAAAGLRWDSGVKLDFVAFHACRCTYKVTKLSIRKGRQRRILQNAAGI